jgi:hypothetical protein
VVRGLVGRVSLLLRRAKICQGERSLKPITEIMHWVETTPLAIYVSQSSFGFSAIDMVHIAAISVVFGTIAILDLRLIGVAFTDFSVTDLSRQVLPWTWAAFGFAAITGTLMFTGQAVKYSANFAFLVKITLMALAGLNVLVFHFMTYRGVAKWDQGTPVPWSAKLAGALSLVIWVAVTAYGRFTAYYMYP